MKLFPLSQTLPMQSYRHSPAMMIRWAVPSDAEDLDVLAELDESPVPAAPLLLAFVGDELWAARSLSTGAVISDPFRPSVEVKELLAERGRQLTVVGRRNRLDLLHLGRRAPVVQI